MMGARSPFHIAIIGGGISGLVLAIALLERNISVTIYEQAPHFGEIGAGVAFGPNAVRAMKYCSPKVYAAFEKVASRNLWEDKKDVWFDFHDAMGDHPVGKGEWLFRLDAPTGGGVHRARFLDELVKLVPEGTAKFNKRFEGLEAPKDGGKVKLMFSDGSEAMADAVIGCDGIKSRVRISLFGEDHPSAHPVYTHTYAYRGLIPVEDAMRELGEDNAVNSKMHLGRGGHILTFPVEHGKTMNVVAFYRNHDPWPSFTKLTLPSEKSHVLADFSHFGPTVQAIIKLLKPDLDCWAIFDLGDHPVPQYNHGRICLLGDAAHATSPHHGAGAGICIEDAAVMANILSDERVREGGLEALERAFEAFDKSRRERTQWLVQSSRRQGKLYDMRAEGVVDRETDWDWKAAHEEMKDRCERIWNGEIEIMADEAISILGTVWEQGSAAQGKL